MFTRTSEGGGISICVLGNWWRRNGRIRSPEAIARTPFLLYPVTHGECVTRGLVWYYEYTVSNPLNARKHEFFEVAAAAPCAAVEVFLANLERRPSHLRLWGVVLVVHHGSWGARRPAPSIFNTRTSYRRAHRIHGRCYTSRPIYISDSAAQNRYPHNQPAAPYLDED